MKNMLCLIVFSLFATIAIQGQGTKEGDYKELDSYYAQMVKDWDLPGASIGIVKDGQLVFTGNYGVLEKGKKEKPNAQTLYAIASNSKAFTSAIMGMLVQEGKLDWDDRVKKYIPYFAMYDSWVSEHMTIRDILSHRVGLGTFSGDNIWYKSNLSTKEIIERIKYVPKAYEFRAGYGYSNLMYITAGEIITALTGKTWGENVEELILKPLEMDRSISSLQDLESKGNYAQPHARKDDENYVIPWVDWENVAATGGLISSVEDISKWMIFNLNNGIHKGDTLLTSATRNMVWTPHTNFLVDHTVANDFNRHFNAYGLGWGLSDYHGRMRVGHTGGYDGFITAINLIPHENLGVVVLTNGVKSPIMAATYYALDHFLGIDSKDWSGELLERSNKNAASDTRIAERKAKRVLKSSPSVPVEKIIGKYTSDLCGSINILKKNDGLYLDFENHPLLSARLTHWHYDVWEIHWDHPQAWFGFGTLKLKTDNNLEVIGFDFDVPNDDFFFEELKPYKTKSP
jgi:CubicO group peptidase (beta-lactamase class C family)